MYYDFKIKTLIKFIYNYEPAIVDIIKKFMTTYTFKSKEELQEAVDMWYNKRKQAKTKYGHISYWDVSNIDDMSDLFYMKKYFNDDI